MEKTSWQEVELIIDQALQKAGEERTTYVEEACGDNERLKSWVTELLESIEDSEGFLDPDSPQHRHIDEALDELAQTSGTALIGEQIGSYKITDLISHGGMGSVYQAERTDESFEHRVAIKIIRRGMDTPSNIARFKQEQQILAGLQHPNIGRLYDGGVTEDGLPYLVMEYIDGQPIDEYCNQQRLPIAQRLALFQTVCDAVQYAHNNLIVHRDLKPDNILITNDGQVKILDFGIAKLMDPALQTDSLYRTQPGAKILTLAYAAPEQLNATPITTGTDIYALGVILYKLLIGVPPYSLEDRSAEESEAIIKDQVPPKLQARFNQLSNRAQQDYAHQRNTKADVLKKEVAGDLEVILAKVLRKRAEERYVSVEQFSEDLKRYKRNLPIEARKGGFRYHTGKFIRRNRTPIAVAALFLFTLTGLTAFYTYRIRAERNQAQLEAEKSQQMSRFLINLFDSANPEMRNYSGSDVTAKQILLAGIDRLDNELSDQPPVYIDLMQSVGDALGNLNQYEESDKAFTKAYQKSIDYYGKQHIETSKILAGRAVERRTGDLNKSLEDIRNALAISEHIPDAQPIDLANQHSILATSLAFTRKYKEAEKEYLIADSLYTHSGNANSLYRYNTLDDLSEVQVKLAKFDQAEANMNKVLDFYSSYYDRPHINMAAINYSLGSLAARKGEFEKSNELIRKALQIRTELTGTESSAVAIYYNQLSLNLIDTGDLEQAKIYAQKSLDIEAKVSGEQSYRYANALNTLGLTNYKLKNYETAIDQYQRSLEIKKGILDPESPSMAVSYYNFASVLQEQGKLRQAKSYFEQVVAIDRNSLGANHPEVGVDMNRLATVLTDLGEYEEAENLFQKTSLIFQEKLPKNHHRRAEHLTDYAKLDLKLNRKEVALSKLNQALSIYEQKPDNYATELKEVRTLIKSI
jgi:serine/threonine protein kinase